MPNPDQLMPLLVMTLLGVAGAVVVRSRPRLAVGLWLCTVAFVPYWLGPTVRAYLPPASALACLLLLVFLPWHRVRPHVGDLVPALLIAIMAVAMVGHATSLPVVFAFVVEWMSAYLLARVLASIVGSTWVYGAFAVVMAAVAILALVEAATSHNIFVELARANSQYATWGTLQFRSGRLRVEGAFGHSIALGVSLAAAIPLALGSRLRNRTKAVIVVLLLLATVATLSRAAMLCAVLGLVLSAVFLRSGFTIRQRLVVFAGLAAVVALLIPVVAETLSKAGQEATTSSEYRVDLISLLGAMNPVGISPTFAISPSGETSFQGFSSVDSQLMLTGLTQGYVALAVVLAGLAVAIGVMVAGRASPPTIALVALIPAFATVALITQYTAVVWFLVGLAVTSQQQRRARTPEDAVAVGDTGGPAPPGPDEVMATADSGHEGQR